MSYRKTQSNSRMFDPAHSAHRPLCSNIGMHISCSPSRHYHGRLTLNLCTCFLFHTKGWIFLALVSDASVYPNRINMVHQRGGSLRYQVSGNAQTVRLRKFPKNSTYDRDRVFEWSELNQAWSPSLEGWNMFQVTGAQTHKCHLEAFFFVADQRMSSTLLLSLYGWTEN